MKKIFKTISASLVTALIVFAAILTAVVLLEMFVVKLPPTWTCRYTVHAAWQYSMCCLSSSSGWVLSSLLFPVCLVS